MIYHLKHIIFLPVMFPGILITECGEKMGLTGKISKLLVKVSKWEKIFSVQVNFYFYFL